jgi:hypothetical protein
MGPHQTLTCGRVELRSWHVGNFLVEVALLDKGGEKQYARPGQIDELHSQERVASGLGQGGSRCGRTSKDWAYQSLTFCTDGMVLRPSGRLLNSSTRWARRIGSSSARNCDARNKVPKARGWQNNQQAGILCGVPSQVSKWRVEAYQLMVVRRIEPFGAGSRRLRGSWHNA